MNSFDNVTRKVEMALRKSELTELPAQPWGIDVQGLTKVYTSWQARKRIVAVDQIKFTVARGEILGLLGPNGAGKTSTIKMICGIVAPTSGTIHVNGFALEKQRKHALSSIGAVLEGSRNVYWQLTPLENMEYFANLRGLSGRAIARRSNELLEVFDLWERRNDPVETLSRGMQQKVALAVALVGDPPVLLLDEPTLGLDVRTAEVVKQQMVHLAKKESRAILLTTHQMELAEGVCDRVAIISGGKIVAQDRVHQLLNLFSVREYHVHLNGHLDETSRSQLTCIGRVKVGQDESHTELVFTLDNVETLYYVIDILKQTHMPIASIERVEPNLADVFVRIIDRGM